MQPIHQTFQLTLSYPVHFTRGAFHPENDLLQHVIAREPGGVGADEPRRVMAVIDSGVVEAFPDISTKLSAWFASRADRLDLVCSPVEVPGGECLKNDYRRLMGLVDQMLEYHLCRHSVVLVIGGGAVLDAVGFGAALVHRGLRVVRMPSTTLAQDDAGIGVKNGMNLHGGKNTVGVFAAPFGVVNDLALLEGLPDARWRDGISEAFKVAMIRDRAFFEELCALSPALGRRDATAMDRVVFRCAELHLEHIATSGDPFELGSARPLDFGHWSAHKLESISHYRISHGHAVAVGIALDSLYAAQLGWIDREDARALLRALVQCGFDLAPDELFQRQGDGRLRILDGLDEFREHLGGELTLSLPAPIGSLREIHQVDYDRVEGNVESLRDRTCA